MNKEESAMKPVVRYREKYRIQGAEEGKMLFSGDEHRTGCCHIIYHTEKQEVCMMAWCHDNRRGIDDSLLFFFLLLVLLFCNPGAFGCGNCSNDCEPACC